MSNKSSKKSPSPRSSPLLHFFNRSLSNASNNNNDDNCVIQSPNSTFSEQSASSALLRSLSKCFDGAMEDAIIDEEEAISAKEGNSRKERGGGMRQSEIPKWGPSHSISDDEDDDDDDNINKNNKKCAKIQQSAATGFAKTFKPVANPSNFLTTISSSMKDGIIPTPTSSSHHSSSNKTPRSNSNATAQTSPITTSTNDPAAQEHSLSIKTGMQSSVSSSRHHHQTNNSINTTNPKTPNAMPSTTITDSPSAIRGAAGGGGVSISNFWNFNVKPFSTDENDTPANCGPSTQSGDAFNRTTTPAVSPSACSPLDNASSTPISIDSNKSAATSPLLSSPAKAAADAVLGMLESLSNRVNQVSSQAEKLFVPAASQFCGPNSPKNGEQNNCNYHTSNESSSLMPNERSGGGMLEKIPENLRVCGNINGGDGDFVDEVDFDNDRNDECSWWRNTRHSSTSWTTTTADKVPPNSPEKERGYEIRLKSTFSRMEIEERRKKERTKQQERQQECIPAMPNLPLNDIEETGESKTTNTASQPHSSAMRRSSASRTPSAFGRTHPNRSRSPSQHAQNYVSNAVDPSSSQQSGVCPQGLPFEYLEVPPIGENEIERSVSELTMRSHGAHNKHCYSFDSRRMAYYAVGRVNQDRDAKGNTKGGNRRCYFTGNPIPYGLPFYAGSVQQGPRTLVVFCLPSALGLPSLHPQPLHYYSKEDRERYLQTLPEPNGELLAEMRKRYPEPFETLPVQVRSPHCWRLFVKFCFFSGLPIAEGEMHYLVKSTVKITPPPSLGQEAPHEFEEIALSHEVLEAVNGVVSAEILRLPNQKTFDYLKRQYCQQSAKLNEEVFDRASWEIVLPEV